MNPQRRSAGPAPVLAAILALALGGGTVLAQDGQPAGGRQEPLPEDLEGVGVTEKLGERIPLDLRFLDQDGRAVTLGEICDGSRPVILNLMYMSCPMLCGLVSNGLSDALAAMKHSVGDEFRVLSVSIDHTETPTLAKAKHEGYVDRYGRPGAAEGWTYLTGDEAAVRSLTDAVGFGFRWNERRQEYAHAAVIILLSPDGQVSRYLYGIQFDPRTLQLSLVEAADGKTGSSLDRFLLFCFHYDADSGRYGPAARNLMKAGGAISIVALAGLVIALRRRERRGGGAAPGA